MAIKQANPDGTITGETNTLANRLNFTNSSMVMPQNKDAIFGAFGDILNLDDTENTPPVDDFTYGVYQIATQKPELEQGQLQNQMTNKN